jgi:hypothetical protein
MPKGSGRPAARRAPYWEPDIYYVQHFLHGIHDLKTNPKNPIVPQLALAKLAGLAGVSDNKIFHSGIMFSVRRARKDFPLLSSSVYRQRLFDRIEKIEQAAFRLQQELDASLNPRDRTTLWAGRVIGFQLNIQSKATGEWETKPWPDRLKPLRRYLNEVSTLMEAAAKAKNSSYLYYANIKGKPSGSAESGMAMTRFIAHLEFAARAAGGGGP